MLILFSPKDLVTVFRTASHARALKFILSRGEVSPSSLKKEVGVSLSQTFRILREFSSAGLVTNIGAGKYRPNLILRDGERIGLNIRDCRVGSLLRKGLAEIILELESNGPIISQRELAKSIGLPQQTVQVTCREMQAIGILTSAYGVNPECRLVPADPLEEFPQHRFVDAVRCFREIYGIHDTQTQALVLDSSFSDTGNQTGAVAITAVLQDVEPRMFVKQAEKATLAMLDAARITTNKHGLIAKMALCPVATVWSYLWNYVKIRHPIMKRVMWGIPIWGERPKRDLREYTRYLFRFNPPTEEKQKEWLDRGSVQRVNDEIVITHKGLLRTRRRSPSRTIIKEMKFKTKTIDIIYAEPLRSASGLT